MIELTNKGNGFAASTEERKNWIQATLATEFSEDKDFLKKINKITFGLMSGD